jgi:hypothetical protein
MKDCNAYNERGAENRRTGFAEFGSKHAENKGLKTFSTPLRMQWCRKSDGDTEEPGSADCKESIPMTLVIKESSQRARRRSKSVLTEEDITKRTKDETER